MNRKVLIIISSLTLVLFAAALVVIGFAAVVGHNLGLFEGRYQQMRQYAALLREIENRFIGDFDVEDINIAAMSAAVASLDDRWSFFLTAEALEALLHNARNQYPGIGIQVTQADDIDGTLIVFVHRDSPAYNAGLVAGDIITVVDGIDVTQKPLDEVIALVRRPIGTSAEITILREDGTTAIKTVVADMVFTNPVEYYIIENDVGLIRLANFGGGAAEQFISAVNTLLGQNVRAFIFDVRGNRGGSVIEMTRILDKLLPEGEIFVTVDRTGEEQVVFSGPEMIDLPMVVLVDRHSYSAAEFFAAIMREYDHAIIVGEQTTGKSRMQTLHFLPGGNAVNLSTAEYLTKNRVSLYGVGGVMPDYLIEFCDEQRRLFLFGRLDFDYDIHIIKALEVLTFLE